MFLSPTEGVGGLVLVVDGEVGGGLHPWAGGGDDVVWSEERRYEGCEVRLYPPWRPVHGLPLREETLLLDTVTHLTSQVVEGHTGDRDFSRQSPIDQNDGKHESPQSQTSSQLSSYPK